MFEELTGQRMTSFILSFPGEHNSDHWVEVTWGYNSKTFLTRQLSSSGVGWPAKEGLSPRARLLGQRWVSWNGHPPGPSQLASLSQERPMTAPTEAALN